MRRRFPESVEYATFWTWVISSAKFPISFNPKIILSIFCKMLYFIPIFSLFFSLLTTAFCTKSSCKLPFSSIMFSSIGSQSSFTFSKCWGDKRGLIRTIPLFFSVSTPSAQRIGIFLLIIGRIIFLPINFLYLLSLLCTTTATSEKNVVKSSTTRVKTSPFASTKHLICKRGCSSSFQMICSACTGVW